jgi:UDP-N-acetylmuramate--alanine ligase
MTMDSKECVSDDALIDVLRTKEIDILLTVGAGDIDAMVPRIAELLNKGRNA